MASKLEFSPLRRVATLVVLVSFLAVAIPKDGTALNFTWTPIATSGLAAPGFPTAVHGSPIPTLSESGTVAFLSEQASDTTSSESFDVLYNWTPEGGTQVVAYQGGPVPDIPGATLGYIFPRFGAFSSGVAFAALLTRSDGSSGTGIFSTVAGQTVLLAQNGDPAPGTTDAFSYVEAIGVGDSGNGAFFGTTSSGAAGYWGFDASGNVSLLGVGGEPIPGDPSGIPATSVSGVPNAVSDSGAIVLSVNVAGTKRLYRFSVEGPASLVAQPGDPVAHDSRVLASPFGDGTAADSGTVVFDGKLRDPITGSENRAAFVADASGDVRIVFVEGEETDGLAIQLADAMSVNSTGMVAGHVIIENTELGSEDHSILFDDGDGNLSILLRESEEVPGFPGSSLSAVGCEYCALNDLGDLVAVAYFADDQGGHQALILFTAEGDAVTIARSGDVIEVAPGDFREIVSLSVPGSTDRGFRGLNDARDVLVQISFTDGSFGSFLASVPEPTTALLLACGLVGLGVRRRRTRSSLVNPELGVALPAKGPTPTLRRPRLGSLPSI